jgi:hypothetical protein
MPQNVPSPCEAKTGIEYNMYNEVNFNAFFLFSGFPRLQKSVG